MNYDKKFQIRSNFTFYISYAMEGGIYVYIFGGNSKKLIGTECCIREMLCLKGENYLHCETQQFNLLTNVQLRKSFLTLV